MAEKHILEFKGVSDSGDMGKSAVFYGKDSDEGLFEGEESIEIVMPKIFKHVQKKFNSLRVLAREVEMKIIFEKIER